MPPDDGHGSPSRGLLVEAAPTPPDDGHGSPSRGLFVEAASMPPDDGHGSPSRGLFVEAASMPPDDGHGSPSRGLLVEAAPTPSDDGHGSPSRGLLVEAASMPPDKMTINRFRPIIPGATYFITSVVHERQRILVNPAFAQIVVDQLKYYEAEYQFDLPAYAVMPDHYHAVISVSEKKTISQILHAVNSYTATLINQHLGYTIKAKIWQGKAWDVVARDDGAYWRMIAYTLLNPWREGLVEKPLQPYPFSNITEWRERDGDEFLLDLFAQIRDWREFGE